MVAESLIAMQTSVRRRGGEDTFRLGFGVQSMIMTKHLRRYFALIALTGLTAGLLLSADAGGDWKASFDFNGAAVPLTFHLKVKDANVTGSVEGLPTTPIDIKDGKVDGDTISFTATTDYQGNPVKLVYKGKIAGDQIKFSMGTEDGSWGVELVAKRSS
jgi:hypothetical protein